MNAGKTMFAQMMEFIPWTSFARIVDRYSGNSGVRRLSSAEQFRVMAFAQLIWRESLRDIEMTLQPAIPKHPTIVKKLPTTFNMLHVTDTRVLLWDLF
jgi:Domain of unknown function (DUF4372)